MPVVVLFVSSSSGIVFNQSSGEITDHSQSAKDIDLYFKSNLYVEDPSHRKQVPILPNGRRKPGERAHVTQNFISASVWCESTFSWSTDQRVITKLSPLSKMIRMRQVTYAFRTNSGDDIPKTPISAATHYLKITHRPSCCETFFEALDFIFI